MWSEKDRRSLRKMPRMFAHFVFLITRLPTEMSPSDIAICLILLRDSVMYHDLDGDMKRLTFLHNSCILTKDLTIFSRKDIGDLQQINRYESSANENDIVLHRGESVFKDERRSEVARMKRIGESEPPCGTPLEIFE